MPDNKPDTEWLDDALLMLTFFERVRTITPDERAQYQSLISSGQAKTSSVALLGVTMKLLADSMGKTHEEMIQYVREILLEIRNAPI